MAKYEKILVLDNEVQARLLEAVLNERRIPHHLRSYHDTAYDGLWQQQQGWGRVEAPAEYRSQILSIHEDLNGRREGE